MGAHTLPQQPPSDKHVISGVGVAPARTLPETLTAYRIGDPDGVHPIFSAEGARQEQGRWHDVGDSVIYASEHCSAVMIETRVHWNGPPPANQHFIEITIPRASATESSPPTT